MALSSTGALAATTQRTVPAASTWSLGVLGVMLAACSALLYRKAYR
jgi:hypothetical protein